MPGSDFRQDFDTAPPAPLRNQGLSGSSAGKESTCNAGDLGLTPGWERAPGGGNSYPLQYSGLENSTDRGAWQATVHGVEKSQRRLSDSYSLPRSQSSYTPVTARQRVDGLSISGTWGVYFPPGLFLPVCPSARIRVTGKADSRAEILAQ